MKQTDSKKPAPDFSYETAYLETGQGPVAGVDEAGRGPWAGPVVAAAVILNVENIPDGLNDSKKLTEAKREVLFDQIKATSKVGVGIVSSSMIDQINVLQATMQAMSEALSSLPDQPAIALIDGNKAPPVEMVCETIKKGDGKSLSIAAASIIAKVTRDRIMKDMDSQFPGYGFARHKGYGTAIHSSALDKLGPCPQHRFSFAPIKALQNDSE